MRHPLPERSDGMSCIRLKIIPEDGISYFKHPTCAFDGILTHLHDPGTNGLAAGDPKVQGRTVMGVFHQTDELGPFNLFERLVASRHPFREKRIKHSQIELALQEFQ